MTMMKPILDSFPVEPAVALEEVERTLGISTKGSIPAVVPGQVSSDRMNLAHDILAYPWDFLNERYKRLGLTGRKAQKAKEELLNNGWVKEHKVQKHGGHPILLEPLKPLADALGQSLPNTGKGGFLHAYAVHVVAERLKTQHYTNIKIEAYFGSKAVDLCSIDVQGNLVGFEIAVSLTNVVDNIEKDFLCQQAFSSVTTICMSVADVRKVKRMIAAAPALTPLSSKINIEPLSKWLP